MVTTVPPLVWQVVAASALEAESNEAAATRVPMERWRIGFIIWGESFEAAGGWRSSVVLDEARHGSSWIAPISWPIAILDSSRTPSAASMPARQ